MPELTSGLYTCVHMYAHISPHRNTFLDTQDTLVFKAALLAILPFIYTLECMGSKEWGTKEEDYKYLQRPTTYMICLETE